VLLVERVAAGTTHQEGSSCGRPPLQRRRVTSFETLFFSATFSTTIGRDIAAPP
jgi:hypothetical protein